MMSKLKEFGDNFDNWFKANWENEDKTVKPFGCVILAFLILFPGTFLGYGLCTIIQKLAGG